jgi:hypothetical protein
LQVPALLPLLNSPVAQLVHTRSTLAVPALATNWPALQSVQATHELALLPELNVPATQLSHVRSLVGVPSALMKLPAAHAVLATHAVAGSPSLSQVPAAQATCSAVPPAHHPPAVHASHTGGVDAVPGAVCTVPGAHAFSGKHSATFFEVLTVPSAQAAHVRSALADGTFVA